MASNVEGSEYRWQNSLTGLLVSGWVNEAAFSYYSRLRRLRRFVTEHYGQPISVEKAAQVTGLSEKYFSTFFRQKTGVCFRDWLTAFRIEQAMGRMMLHNESITRIALEVGFQDLRTFERAFKKVTGITPATCKKRLRPA